MNVNNPVIAMMVRMVITPNTVTMGRLSSSAYFPALTMIVCSNIPSAKDKSVLAHSPPRSKPTPEMIKSKAVKNSSIRWRNMCLVFVLCNSGTWFVDGRESHIPIIIRPIRTEYAVIGVPAESKSINISHLFSADLVELFRWINVFDGFYVELFILLIAASCQGEVAESWSDGD